MVCLPLLEYDGRIHPFWPLGSGCPPWPWGIWSMNLSWPFSGTCTALSQAFEGAKLHEKAAVPEILCAAVMSNQQVLCRPAAFKQCQQEKKLRQFWDEKRPEAFHHHWLTILLKSLSLGQLVASTHLRFLIETIILGVQKAVRFWGTV